LLFSLYCIIKKPQKDVSCLTRTPCSFGCITRALHIYSCPRNGYGDCLVMKAAERQLEIKGMVAPAEMVLLDFLF
jgi:hypothetical protein